MMVVPLLDAIVLTVTVLNKINNPELKKKCKSY